jgi:hypothetical protein
LLTSLWKRGPFINTLPLDFILCILGCSLSINHPNQSKYARAEARSLQMKLRFTQVEIPKHASEAVQLHCNHLPLYQRRFQLVVLAPWLGW